MTTPSAARPSTEWTIRALMDWTEKHFQHKGVESPRLEAQLLLAHALKCKKTDLYTRWDEPVAEDRRGAFRELIKRRLEGCPVQYLLGYREFFLLEFEVTPAVLIPRPETELLVTEAIKAIKAIANPRVLDLGTGSGCIAVTIAHRNKSAQVTASDISEDALQVARRNAVKHVLSERIRFVQGDLFEPIHDEQFDLIISNPPYVSSSEYDALPKHVRDFEPRTALWAGPDGFAVYDRLISTAMKHLCQNGWLLLEIGAQQESGIRQRLESAGLTAIAVLRDDQNHPRVAVARKGA